MKKIATIISILICMFSFSVMTVFAESEQESEIYSDGRIVENNDIRYISPEEMYNRFVEKTAFMNDEKYNTIMQNMAIRFNSMLTIYLDTTNTNKLVDYFPENYADFTDYEKFIFIWTYGESCENLKVYSSYATYDNSVKPSLKNLTLYYPQDDVEGATIYTEAVTEVLTWHYNNWLLETTVYNPYEYVEESTTESVIEENTILSTSEKKNEDVIQTSITTEIQIKEVTPKKSFLQKYWFSFLMIGISMLVFVVYKIIKSMKNR